MLDPLIMLQSLSEHFCFALLVHFLPNNHNNTNTDTFKIINQQTHVMDDGKLFPFVSSTGLHPEWPVAALDHVNRDVAKDVQEALLALRDHAAAIEAGKNIRCDTTRELSLLALASSHSGAFTGWRTARSYFEVRTKQEAGRIFERGRRREPPLYSW